MIIELLVCIPPEVVHVNMVSVLYQDKDIGYINHVIKQIDGDLHLCSIDIRRGKEEFASKIRNK